MSLVKMGHNGPDSFNNGQQLRGACEPTISSNLAGNTRRTSQSSRGSESCIDACQVSVTEYTIHKATFPYAVFTVLVKWGPTEQIQVLRRYNDFVELRSLLAISFPPPIIAGLVLPRKRWFKRNKFEPEFMEDRQRGLETFLRQIVTSPVLFGVKVVQDFLGPGWKKAPPLRKLQSRNNSPNMSPASLKNGRHVNHTVSNLGQGKRAQYAPAPEKKLSSSDTAQRDGASPHTPPAKPPHSTVDVVAHSKNNGCAYTQRSSRNSTDKAVESVPVDTNTAESSGKEESTSPTRSWGEGLTSLFSRDREKDKASDQDTDMNNNSGNHSNSSSNNMSINTNHTDEYSKGAPVTGSADHIDVSKPPTPPKRTMLLSGFLQPANKYRTNSPTSPRLGAPNNNRKTSESGYNQASPRSSPLGARRNSTDNQNTVRRQHHHHHSRIRKLPIPPTLTSGLAHPIYVAINPKVLSLRRMFDTEKGSVKHGTPPTGATALQGDGENRSSVPIALPPDGFFDDVFPTGDVIMKQQNFQKEYYSRRFKKMKDPAKLYRPNVLSVRNERGFR